MSNLRPDIVNTVGILTHVIEPSFWDVVEAVRSDESLIETLQSQVATLQKQMTAAQAAITRLQGERYSSGRRLVRYEMPDPGTPTVSVWPLGLIFSVRPWPPKLRLRPDFDRFKWTAGKRRMRFLNLKLIKSLRLY